MTTVTKVGEGAATLVKPSRPMLFLEGLIFSLIAINLAAYFVPDSNIGPLSISITALGLLESISMLFARHRDISWSGSASPTWASFDLVGNLGAVFLGVVIGFGLFAGVLSEFQISEFFSFQLKGVFLSRIIPSQTAFSGVFLVAFSSGLLALALALLLAALFKEGGVALLIAWLGSIWGVAIVTLSRESFLIIGALEATLTLAALLCASAGFITISMTGLFLARGARKCALRSPVYMGIVRTSLLLISVAAAFILLGAYITSLAGAL